MPMRIMRSSLVKAFGLLLALTTAAAAQDYPVKPVRLLIPFAPGGSVDLVGRIVATKLGERLGRQVVADNRAGAGGTIATELAANAPPDGYTLLLVSMAHAINPWVYKINYDPIRAFAPIASLGNGASVLTVHPSVPANSVKELIALAKSKPGQLNFAHAGVGSFTHTAGVLLAMMAGIDVKQVPFRGGGPAMIDVIGGHLVGRRGTSRHAATGHRQAAQGDYRGPELRRGAEAVRRRRRRDRTNEHGRVHHLHRNRTREVGKGGQGGQDQGRVG